MTNECEMLISTTTQRKQFILIDFVKLHSRLAVWFVASVLRVDFGKKENHLSHHDVLSVSDEVLVKQ